MGACPCPRRASAAAENVRKRGRPRKGRSKPVAAGDHPLQERWDALARRARTTRRPGKGRHAANLTVDEKALALELRTAILCGVAPDGLCSVAARADFVAELSELAKVSYFFAVFLGFDSLGQPPLC